MTFTPTRRAVCAALPVLAAPAAASSAHATADPHPEWLATWRDARARWEELAVRPGNERWDCPETLHWEAVEREAELCLHSVAPRTVAGALACLTWIEEDCGPSSWLCDGHGEALSHALRALRAEAGA